ncbi:MAG: GNAT family N-acetyltransferase [Tenericutes bacterium]|nr:GNAT family N-acetyltransferase [Mycoplasmatota bacterium]
MRIDSKKVYTRAINETDTSNLKEYLEDEFTMRFFDHGVLDEAGILELIKSKDPVHGIILKENNKLIGHFVYHNWFMRDTYEIGWVLNKKYQNLGIITELGEAFIKHAFEVDKAHRIVATCQPENIASKRVCEKLKLRLEGHFKKCIYVERKNEWWDELFYSLLEED